MSFLEFITPPVLEVFKFIFFLLSFLTIVFYSIRYFKGPSKFVDELISRTNSWWVMIFVFIICVFLNKEIATISLALLSAIAFYELTKNISLRSSDGRALFWAYSFIPFQFLAAYIQYWDLFVILIPVILFVFLTFRTVAYGDIQNITRSMGIIHWSLMVTVFSFSHLAYILGFPEKSGFVAGNGGLILFLVLLTEINDVFQFTWGKLLGKRKIIPTVSPNKTLEGFLGGLISTTLLGSYLSFLLPVQQWQATLLAFMIGFTGFLGDVVISAVKRDHKIKDMGTLIPGHGGIMDRVDSLAFTSIVFFYLIRYWSYK